LTEAKSGEAPSDPYAGKTRQELFEILKNAGGKKNQVPNPKEFQAAWKAAPVEHDQNDEQKIVLRELEAFKKLHPEYYPPETPIEAQLKDYKKQQQKRNQDEAEKRENFKKMDRVVEQKTSDREERKKRDHIEQEADRILREGDPVTYLKEQFSKIHIGDDIIFYGLLASIGSQLCRPSDGIQPGLTGESGKGKTDACRALYHLLPKDFKMKGSFSNKSFFYYPIKVGTILFFDDAARLSEEIQDMIKQSTSAFQEPFIHRTVDRGSPRELPLPPRLVYWITSVGGNYEMQFLNRQMNLSVDDSTNQDERVMSVTLERYQQGDSRFSESEEVHICREIIKTLKDREPVTVKIPFTDEIHWNQPKNRRNLPMFLDTVNSFAAIRQLQRDRDPSGAILASSQDFKLAKDLWTGIAREQVGKLSKDDLRLLNCIMENGEKSYQGIYSIPRNDAKIILLLTCLNMHLILNGNDGVGGLNEKLEGFNLEKGTKTIELDGGGHKTVHCDSLEYNGALDTFGQFNDIVWLKD
jgi:hypothetical protein